MLYIVCGVVLPRRKDQEHISRSARSGRDFGTNTPSSSTGYFSILLHDTTQQMGIHQSDS